MIKKILTIFILISAIAIFFSYKSTKQEVFQTICGTYEIESMNIGDKETQVFVSDDDCKRELGLSGQKSLKNNDGMLFIFPKSGNYAFWMQDMNFPLDMVWISENNSIVGIEKNIATTTYPQSFGLSYTAKYVLEVNDGFADENNLKVGEKINFEKSSL